MTASSYAVTGPVIAGDSTHAIKAGTIGNLLNMVGADHVREMQRLAVEESRLGIPLLIGFDIVHGHRTLVSDSAGRGGAVRPRDVGAHGPGSREGGRGRGLAMTFAPMLDVARDPRWGRSAEGPGEDPWLAARIAESKVHGFQGADLAAPDALAAIAKHFCAYGAVTAGRDYASVDISERTLHEVYLPSFAAAVAAGVAAIMPAFTDLAGIPMTANDALLRRMAARSIGFRRRHRDRLQRHRRTYAPWHCRRSRRGGALALKAGVDIDMMADAYRRGLPVALERGWVTIGEIDESVRRVLTLKKRLGLFDDPYRRGAVPEPPRRSRRAGARSHRRLACHRDAEKRRGGAAARRHGCGGSRWSARWRTHQPTCAAPGGVPRARRRPGHACWRVCGDALADPRVLHARGVDDRRRGCERHGCGARRCASRRTPSCCAWAKLRR